MTGMRAQKTKRSLAKGGGSGERGGNAGGQAYQAFATGKRTGGARFVHSTFKFPRKENGPIRGMGL